MNLRGCFKYIYALLFWGAFRRKLRRLSSNQGVFLTYHRILPFEMVSTCIEPGMYVTPSTFKTHIRFLKKYFEIVTIDQVETILEGTSERETGKPYCVISFDDGWRDFYTYAWPVLYEEGVPAVVFLPTGLIGTDKMFWTDRLALILEESGMQSLITAHGDRQQWEVVGKVSSFQGQLADAIVVLKKLPHQKIDEILHECEGKIGSTQNFINRTFMNWDEVRELFDSELISFGSHTENHAILTTLSHDEIQIELEVAKKKLFKERVVGQHISFCYPNGNFSQEIVQLVKLNGYSSAVSCDPGWNKPGADLFSLKRISLHQDISSSLPLLVYRLLQYS